jgi:hypothetical protein
LTIVYGPVDSPLINTFWNELNNLGTTILNAWLMCDDFNLIRFRHKKSEVNFKSRVSKKFNSFLEDFRLFEYELSSRKYTWSNET